MQARAAPCHFLVLRPNCNREMQTSCHMWWHYSNWITQCKALWNRKQSGVTSCCYQTMKPNWRTVTARKKFVNTIQAEFCNRKRGCNLLRKCFGTPNALLLRKSGVSQTFENRFPPHNGSHLVLNILGVSCLNIQHKMRAIVRQRAAPESLWNTRLSVFWVVFSSAAKMLAYFQFHATRWPSRMAKFATGELPTARKCNRGAKRLRQACRVGNKALNFRSFPPLWYTRGTVRWRRF